MEAKIITMDNVFIMPPMPGVCQECAVQHDPAMPHDKDSLYYQMRFYQKNKRWPTWADAMRHCNELIKAAWKTGLLEKGVKPEELEDGS